MRQVGNNFVRFGSVLQVSVSALTLLVTERATFPTGSCPEQVRLSSLVLDKNLWDRETGSPRFAY